MQVDTKFHESFLHVARREGESEGRVKGGEDREGIEPREARRRGDEGRVRWRRRRRESCDQLPASWFHTLAHKQKTPVKLQIWPTGNEATTSCDSCTTAFEQTKITNKHHKQLVGGLNL